MNNLKFNIINNACNHLKDKLNDFYGDIDYKTKYGESSQLYSFITKKIEKLSYEKIILELFSLEMSVDEIASICDVSRFFVENIKIKNLIFFENKILNLEKLEKVLSYWEYELKLEIIKRTWEKSKGI